MDASATAAGTLRRDMRVIGLISGAHFFSHFYQLVLPPLFPLLRLEFDVSYTALGLLTGLFFITGAVTQPAVGFLVDRYGARPLLLAGLALMAAAVAALGLAPGYGTMVPVIIVAGLGNAVFHPADFAILNASVHASRLGRAYGAHGIFGNIGWAAAPVAVLSLTALFGWRMALVTLGCIGLAAAVYLASQGAAMADHRRTDKGPAASATTLVEDLGMLMTPTILVTFAFFALTSMALVGIQTFVPTALMDFHHLPLAVTTAALTAFLLAAAAGTFGGGILVDRFKRPELIVGACLGLFMLVFLALTIQGLPDVLIIPILAVAGALLGATSPSRDMLVRQKTPAGAAGKVYGFVYSGLDLGAAVIPPVFGWLIDRGEPRLVFVVVSGAIALSVLTIIQLDRRGGSYGVGLTQAAEMNSMLPFSRCPDAALRRVKFVFTDIDDTLTSEGQLTAEAYQAIERLTRAGLIVIPITGRPAGWCDHIARFWPVDAVVGENGAFWFRYDRAARQLVKRFLVGDAERAANRRRLERIGQSILAAVPGTALASDQLYREADIAIDFCEDVPRLDEASVDRIVALMEAEGMTAKVSSIHVNGWFGQYDKLGMTRTLLREVYDVDLDAARGQCAFLGDSPNDSPLFGYFPLSLGVANIRAFLSRLSAAPAYVMRGRGGQGFAEFARRLLRAKKKPVRGKKNAPEAP